MIALRRRQQGQVDCSENPKKRKKPVKYFFAFVHCFCVLPDEAGLDGFKGVTGYSESGILPMYQLIQIDFSHEQAYGYLGVD